jgi:hypothetical protein
VTSTTVDAAPPSGGGTARRPSSWSLQARLTALFALAGVIVVLVTSIAAASLIHLIDTRHVLLTQIDPASLSSDQLLEAYLDEETGVRGYLLTRDLAFLAPYVEGSANQRVASADLHSALADHPDLLHLATEVQVAAAQWNRQFAVPAVLAARAGTTVDAEQQLLGPGKTRFDLVRARVAALDAALSAQRTASGTALSDATSRLIATLVVGLLLLVVAGFGTKRALRNWVTDPLARLADSVRRVSGGELARTVESGGPPEIARLGTDVEAMRLRIVRELDEVATARAELAETNLDLVRSNEELEQFAYVASHDLQEPLRKVTSFVQLLQQRYDGQLDERADQYIAFAVDGSKRMQDLINDLLTFSRVGRTTDAFAPVDTGAAARDAVAVLAEPVDAQGATVTIGQLPTVAGDRVLLTSLFQNLIGNAIKFRGPEPPVVAVDAVPDTDGGWLFTVADNGIGIEPRFADRVFVIFQRLHARDAFEGTGIGLALCKKIVEYHGGTIRVDTEFTGGTRLCFSLPSFAEGGAPWHVAEPAPRSSS